MTDLLSFFKRVDATLAVPSDSLPETPHELGRPDRSRWLQAEFDRLCEEFATERYAEPRLTVLEKMYGVVAEMDAIVRVVEPVKRPRRKPKTARRRRSSIEDVHAIDRAHRFRKWYRHFWSGR